MRKNGVLWALALIPSIMDRVRESEAKAVGYVYGDGEGEIFKELRKAKKIKIQGYYRQGTLPALLAKDKITVAVLPSISPEAYALVVDECLAAGISVVAFEHGAVGERLSYWEVGDLVPLTLGTDGLADTVIENLGRKQQVPDSAIRTLPQIDRVARKYLEIYKGQRARAR